MTSRTLIPKERFPWGHLVRFGWMPSALKVWCYKHLLGYRIGRNVSLAPGAVVVAEDVDIDDDVSIGFLTIVRGRRVKIGRHSQIGATSYVYCEAIEIGEDAKINEQVYVGGPMLPESLFRLGNRTIVMQMSFLNPTKPLIIGDDTGIGGHCLIFTHGSWLNVLDGYPVTFEPVTLGASVWLPWRVFVMPGATIGDGSVIGANSLVQGDIPARSLAVGAPAKVIRSAPDFPRALTDEKKQALISTMLAEFDRFVRAAGVVVETGGVYVRGSERCRLLRIQTEGELPHELKTDDVVMPHSPLGQAARASLRRAKVSWLDLEGRSRSPYGNPLCEELALFLSRYGIRLRRDR